MRPSRKTKRRPVLERLMERVVKDDQTGCWNFTGALNSAGYGHIGEGREKVHRAHRVTFTDANGPIPDGLVVCHRCDNPACVNPEHLFLGTQKDNAADMANKGRSTRGTRNPCAKLDERSVRAIRELLAAGAMTQQAIGEVFGVSRRAVGHINKGACWGWLARNEVENG